MKKQTVFPKIGSEAKVDEPNARVITWQTVDRIIDELCNKLLNLGVQFSGVYGIPKGGLIPAVMLSSKLKLPLLQSPQTNSIIIDDDCLTGSSFQHWLSDEWKDSRKVYKVALYAMSDTAESVLDFFGERVTFYKEDGVKGMQYPWRRPLTKYEDGHSHEPQVTIRKRIVAVDFDGTLGLLDAEGVLRPNIYLFKQLKKYEDKVHIILWTCRVGKLLDEAVQFAENHGLRIKFVNENVDKTLPDCRKVFADLYIDDLSGDVRQQTHKIKSLIKRG